LKKNTPLFFLRFFCYVWSYNALCSLFPAVSLSNFLVPIGLLFLFSAAALWVWVVSRKAAHKREQLLRLSKLNTPKKGKNHVSVTERVYRLGAPLHQDPREQAVWRQWEDLRKLGPTPASPK